MHNPFRKDATHLQKHGLFIFRIEKWCLIIKYVVLFLPDKYMLTDLALIQDYMSSECLIALGILRNFIVIKSSRKLSLSIFR